MTTPQHDETGWGKNSALEKLYISERLKRQDKMIKESYFIASQTCDSEKTSLDLGCGIGWHACGLTEKGFHASGIDISSTALKYAKKHAMLRNLQVNFICGDFTKNMPQGLFGVITLLDNTFGLMAENENIALLAGLTKYLDKNGTLVIGTYNREYIMTEVEFNKNNKKKWQSDDKKIFYEEASFDLYTGRYNKKQEIMDIASGQKTYCTAASVRLYSLTEYRHITNAVGLKIEKAFGSCLGHQYSASSKESVLFLRKG